MKTAVEYESRNDPSLMIYKVPAWSEEIMSSHVPLVSVKNSMHHCLSLSRLERYSSKVSGEVGIF